MEEKSLENVSFWGTRKVIGSGTQKKTIDFASCHCAVAIGLSIDKIDKSQVGSGGHFGGHRLLEEFLVVLI